MRVVGKTQTSIDTNDTDRESFTSLSLRQEGSIIPPGISCVHIGLTAFKS